jgi:hypothetical protein
MSLLWAVPVVAVATAAALVLGRVRTLERESLGLVVAVRRTAELRRPLAELRTELGESGPLVEAVWSHWEPHDDPDEGASQGPDGGPETPREQGTSGR